MSPLGAAAWLGGLAAALARHAQSGHRQDVQSLDRDRRSAAFTGSVCAAVEPLYGPVDVAQCPLGGHDERSNDLPSGLIWSKRRFGGELVNLVEPEALLLLEFCVEARQVSFGHQSCLGGPGGGLDLLTHSWFLLCRKGWGTAHSSCRLGGRL